MKHFMNLNKYLQENHLSLARFGKLAKLSAATVLRAKEGTVVCSLKTMKQIEAATGGAVTRFDLISAIGNEEDCATIGKDGEV